METPPKPALQSARQSSKQSKTRIENQKSVHSDNDAYLVAPQEGHQTPSKKKHPRKKSNARKNGIQSDVGETIDQPSTKQFNQTKHTPAKAIKSDAYAGPTFHQSPAASALPMPTFFSKSVPNTAVSTVAETKQEAVKEAEENREPTPLDWMFNAARQSRATPTAPSPARLMSPASTSPAPSPGARKEEMDFPFEFDSADGTKSTSTTPFSQRLAASQTAKSTSEGGQTMTDEERKAKTAALKKALMNSETQNPSQLGPAFNDNPFNARSAPTTQNFSPRHTSNPATPTYSNGFVPNQPNPYFQYGPQSPNRNFSTQYNNRPPSSNLRNIYDPGTGPPPMSPPATDLDTRISTARSPQPTKPLNFGAIYGQPSRPRSEGNSAGHASKPSLEQGLDDLKKALNMNFLGQA